MQNKSDKKSRALFIPHGGGPLPLLGDAGHQELVDFLQEFSLSLGRPSAIIVISAHWEEHEVTITSGEAPSLIYDYSGFPAEAYKIKYPASGSPELANRICDLFQAGGIEIRLDNKRGFDHGLFVPLKIMFPDADVPCIQISLLNSLDAKAHLLIGKVLSGLKNENVLIIGSGFSFHNMKAFFSQASGETDDKNEAFEDWLVDACTNDKLTETEREQKLSAWNEAPFARYCHPREEHLLPLHVCYGFAGSAAKLVYEGKVIGKRASAFLW